MTLKKGQPIVTIMKEATITSTPLIKLICTEKAKKPTTTMSTITKTT